MTEPLALFDADLAPARSAIAAAVEQPGRPAEADPATHPAARSGGRDPNGRSTDPRPPTLLAVDGDALVHRAFHAYGQTTGGARYGFFALLSVVCDQASYDSLVVGFDCRERSHRRERFGDYKAQRPDKHEQLDASLAELPGIAADMGAYVVTASGWEADDVVASAAAAAERAGWRCVVASPDRDVLGLVSAATTVVQVRGGRRPVRRVTTAGFRRRYRIGPQQYTQLAALRGDASDNLPGITGIGAKKAAELLRLYPTVDDAVADPLGCRSVLGPELGQALIDDLADAASVFRRNVELMTLRRDLPVDLDEGRPRATPDGIMTVLRRWRMTGLHTRMCAALCPHDHAAPATDADVPPEPPWGDAAPGDDTR